MTLIVGIICADGIVIAADQQATHGAMGVPTVGQAVTKVRIVDANILFAGRGHVGLGQQLCSVIDRKKTDIRSKLYNYAIRDIQADFRALIEPAFRMAKDAAQVVGPQAAQNDVVYVRFLTLIPGPRI